MIPTKSTTREWKAQNTFTYWTAWQTGHTWRLTAEFSVYMEKLRNTVSCSRLPQFTLQGRFDGQPMFEHQITWVSIRIWAHRTKKLSLSNLSVELTLYQLLLAFPKFELWQAWFYNSDPTGRGGPEHERFSLPSFTRFQFNLWEL